MKRRGVMPAPAGGNTSPASGGSVQAAVSRAGQGIRTRLQVLGRLIIKYPHLLIIPLVVLGLLLGLGLWGVDALNESKARDNKESAYYAAENAASALQLELYKAIIPLKQTQVLIRKYRNVSKVLEMTDALKDMFWEAAPPGVLSLGIVPLGHYARSYTAPGALNPDLYPLGADLTSPSSPLFSLFMQNMRNRNVSVSGPWKKLLGPNSVPAEVLSYELNTVLSDVNYNETFGYPKDFTTCPVGVCYDPKTRTKVWGASFLSINTLVTFQNCVGLLNLLDQGWDVLLTRPGVALAGEGPAVSIFSSANYTEAPDHAIKLPVIAGDQEWTLSAWDGDSWDEADLSFLYAVVVIGSVIISALLFAVLVAWVENRALLHSLLPKEMIDRMRMEGQWAAPNEDEFKAIELETPAQGILTIINTCLTGDMPALPRLLAMRDALQRSVDVYRPMASTVKERMQKAEFLDEEVREALTKQLAVSGQGYDEHDSAQGRKSRLALSRPDGMSAVGSIKSVAPGLAPSSPAVLTEASNKDILHYAVQALLMEVSIQSTVLVPAVGSAELDNAEDSEDGGHSDDVSIKGISIGVPLITQIEQVLFTANTWAFDAYALEEAAHGHPLSVLGFWVLQNTGLVAWAHMDVHKLIRFLQHVEQGYSSDNPYHNKRHAADVLQSMHVIMHRGGMAPGYVDQPTMLAAYLAAIVHDYEHRGRNNDYLINAYDELALRYHDRSPMENHHLAAAFGLLRDPELDCLSKLPKATFNKIRKIMIEMVLATEASQASSGGGDLSTVSSVKPVSDADRTLSLQMALKCADLGHLTAPLSVHLKWVSGLEEEFFKQGDPERAQGLPISPLCDRTKEGVTKSQIGFFEFVVLPLFKAFTARFHAAHPMMCAIKTNYQHWQAVASQQKPH